MERAVPNNSKNRELQLQNSGWKQGGKCYHAIMLKKYCAREDKAESKIEKKIEKQ